MCKPVKHILLFNCMWIIACESKFKQKGSTKKSSLHYAHKTESFKGFHASLLMATTLSLSSYPLLISPTFTPTSKFGNFCHSVELSIKDPKLGVLGMSFVKTRDEIKSRMTKVHIKKNGKGPNWFSHLNWCSQEFQPQFLDFSSLHLQCHSNSSFNQLLSKYNRAKFCELISIKQYPVSLILPLHSNWGCNRGLQGQTRGQRQGDSKHNHSISLTV